MISGEMRTLLDNLLTCQQEGCPCAGSRARKALSDAIETKEAELKETRAQLDRADALIEMAVRRFIPVKPPDDWYQWFEFYGLDIRAFYDAFINYRTQI